MKRRRKRRIAPGGKPVEVAEQPKSKFREVLSARMSDIEDPDLERTVRPPKLPDTTPPEL